MTERELAAYLQEHPHTDPEQNSNLKAAVNHPNYCDRGLWGPLGGKGGKLSEPWIQEFEEMKNGGISEVSMMTLVIDGEIKSLDDLVQHSEAKTNQKTKAVAKTNQVSANNLITFAKNLDGQEVQTRKRKSQFTIQVTDAGIEFIPNSGTPRKEKGELIERICKQFSVNNSFNTREYNYSMNASYVLALIEMYLSQ